MDLTRWLRYNRLAFKTAKVDVYIRKIGPPLLPELLKAATDLDLALSLRIDSGAPLLGGLEELRARGLHDLLICANAPQSPALSAWLKTCRDAALPVRIEFTMPFESVSGFSALARFLAEQGVTAVNLDAADPFGVNRGRCAGAAASQRQIDESQRFAFALEEVGIEANILHVPMCLIDEEHRIRSLNAPQCAFDHQQYTGASLKLAQTLDQRRPRTAERILLSVLARQTLHQHSADDLLLPWLLDRKLAHLLAGIWRRLPRFRPSSRAMRAVPAREMLESERASRQKRLARRLGPACSKCSLYLICDHPSDAFESRMPELRVAALPGPVLVDRLALCARQPKHYDSIDSARWERDAGGAPLADEGSRRIAQRTPEYPLRSEDYGVANGHMDRQEGGVKWFSYSDVEKLSTTLASVEPPFAVAFDLGGGTAEYGGFALGRHGRMMCRLEGHRHSVALYVNEEGHCALLRDGKSAAPVELDGGRFVPTQLGGVLQPRIALQNIEELITTSNVRVWSFMDREERPPQAAKYSVLIVSTRFTRRLQAVLRCIAHQREFDLAQIEIIVCYVPGADATDDLLDSVREAYPELRILRSPFPEEKINSKGYLINESLPMASGEWVMLLDSDTLLPPNMFAEIEKLSEDAEFIAPDGRKLLTPSSTGKILMGEIDPWAEWGDLLKGAGEYLHREAKGVPVGFCQCVRKRYLVEFPYLEMDHFEWADMVFGRKMRERIGQETRLSGLPVLHLDHGSSQWFGTRKHY